MVCPMTLLLALTSPQIKLICLSIIAGPNPQAADSQREIRKTRGAEASEAPGGSQDAEAKCQIPDLSGMGRYVAVGIPRGGSHPCAHRADECGYIYICLQRNSLLIRCSSPRLCRLRWCLL